MLIHNFYCFLLNEIVHIYYIEGIKSCSEDTTTTTTLLQFVLFTGFGLASSRNYQSLYPSTPILNYHSYLPLYESNQYFVALINCIKSNYIYIYIYIYMTNLNSWFYKIYSTLILTGSILRRAQLLWN
jgi:hypothetical protein